MARFGDQIIVWGGSCEGPPISGLLICSDAGVFDLALDRWVDAPPGLLMEQDRVGSVTVVSDDALHVFGGIREGRLVEPGMSYDAASDTWEEWPTEGGPGGRREHAAVIVGDYFLVWGGGRETGSWLHEGARFDLRTKRWLPMAALIADEAFVPSQQSSLIAANGRMFLLGKDCIRMACQAFSYDPVADTWRREQGLEAEYNQNAEVLLASTGSEILAWPAPEGVVAWNLEYESRAPIDIPMAGQPSSRVAPAHAWLPNANAWFIWGGILTEGMYGAHLAAGALLELTAE